MRPLPLPPDQLSVMLPFLSPMAVQPLCDPPTDGAVIGPYGLTWLDDGDQAPHWSAS